MINIQISIRSEKKDVIKFLEKLNTVLCDENFDIDRNLILIKSKKEKGKEKFSTPYTLLNLEYEPADVIHRLKELTVREYSETKVDKDDQNPPLLFVFGKDIQSRMVYIKLKIKGGEKKNILCLSFHYAEREMEFPYA